MANNLQKKPFLDYQTQIKYLKQKQLVITDEVSAITALGKASYYGLINGYKDIFKDPNTNNFYLGTTFDDIYNLYLFDAELRDVFLKYILIFEKHVKSSISYHFSNTYGNGIAFYQDINNYDYGNHLSDVRYLFRKMNGKINGRHPSPQVAHTIFKLPWFKDNVRLAFHHSVCAFSILIHNFF